MRTNSGTSGTGKGGAAQADVMNIDALTMLPSAGWQADQERPASDPSAPPQSFNPVLSEWFDYDASTHRVTPRKVVFAIRTADGHGAAVQVLGYRDGVYSLRMAFAGPGSRSFR